MHWLKTSNAVLTTRSSDALRNLLPSSPSAASAVATAFCSSGSVAVCWGLTARASAESRSHWRDDNIETQWRNKRDERGKKRERERENEREGWREKKTERGRERKGGRERKREGERERKRERGESKEGEIKKKVIEIAMSKLTQSSTRLCTNADSCIARWIKSSVCDEGFLCRSPEVNIYGEKGTEM